MSSGHKIIMHAATQEQVRLRSDILSAYRIFSPASADVIARMEHMEQVPHIETHCNRLVEDGLLMVEASIPIREYRITEYGMGALSTQPNTYKVSTSKYVAYQQLREKERKNRRIQTIVHDLLRTSDHFLTPIQIMDDSRVCKLRITTSELNSLLYGMLHAGTIVVCGPLFGCP